MQSRLFFLIRICSLFLLITLVACSSSTAQPPLTEEVKPELESYFQGFEGAFVLYDLNQNHYTRYNPDRCAERLLPASTFKIMNALVALETGVIKDQDQVITWDGTQYPIPAWNQDHTLKTAFRDSVVWYYKEVAQRIGTERMQHYIDAVGYGNQTIHEGENPFWLDNSLQISADEQVEFLKRLYQNDLPFSKRSMEIVREMMKLDVDSLYPVSGKTGTGQVGVRNIGWFVGYQEVEGNVYIFALNITGSDPEITGLKAREIVLNILQDQDCSCTAD